MPTLKGLICTMMPNSPLGRKRNPLLQTAKAFAKISQISCALETFSAASWVTFSVGVFDFREEWVCFLCSEQNSALFSCPVPFSRWIFVHLAGSVPSTQRFSPSPSRVASPELLVFMSVNRFPKLPSQNI